MRATNISTSLLFLAGLAVPAAMGEPIASTVLTEAGPYKGNPRSPTGVLEFLGIPYAAPPVGDLRWRSPAPAPKHCETLNATSYGATPYQAELGAFVAGPISEDCLNLNVWTGANDTAEKRPVMVWIYGGGFEFGTSSQATYNGSNLATEGVVLVSFNYRLGVFGFLAHPELDEEGSNSGDFGLQDQIAALRWVQANIAQFGGDPDNVTIFGQSAGAHSVGLLLASELTTGLFARAILESGSYWDSEHGSLPSFEAARIRGTAFQHKLGAANVAALRALNATQVNNAGSWNSSTDPAITAFAPSIDKYVVPGVPADIFSQGKAQKVPILAGLNGDEGFLFIARALPRATTQQYAQSVNTLFAKDAAEALQLYPGTTQAQANSSADAMIGDLVIAQQTWEAVDSHAQAGDQTCYGYHFTYTSAYSPKAIHTAEIAFVFGNLGPNPIFGTTPPPSDADVALSKAMMTYWVNFAKTGNPNLPVATKVEWPAYSPGGKDFLELGTTVQAVSAPSLDQYEFIRSLRTNGALPVRWGHLFTDN